MDYIVQDFTNDINIYLPENNRSQMANIINSIKEPDLSKEDKVVSDSNTSLLKSAIMVLCIVLLIGIFAAYKICEKYGLNFKDIVKNGSIVVCFIALTEYCFLTFVGKNFKSADPNTVKLALINSLQDYTKN